MCEDRKMLERIDAFVKIRLDNYGSGSLTDVSSPMEDMYEINNIIESYKKKINNSSKKIPNKARERFSEKKRLNNDSIKYNQEREEMIKYNICPECGCDLNVTFSKWYQIFKHDYVKTCIGCGFIKKDNFVRGTGPR